MVEQKKDTNANAEGRNASAESAKVDKTVSIAIRRCPHCGASDVSTNATTGKLRCNFCKNEFDAPSANAEGTIETFENIKGDVVGVGASNIVPGEDIIVTLKCPSCGAEVVVNTAENLSMNCHWCRHVLTVSHKIPNGAVPDLVLPFKITKKKAIEKMSEWLEEYKSEMSATLASSFKLDDTVGVYFPYMVTDVKAHSTAFGQGEHTKSHGADGDVVEVYSVNREFDLYVDDLTIESSLKRLYQDRAVNSNNVINSIMPFDTENAVAWNANYLRGFSSERRDANVNDLKELVALQAGDIARSRMKETTEQYDRGLRWQKEHLSIKGVNWKAAYLPVWLYSFSNPEKNDERIYYIAVNARTGETSGFLPVKGFSLGKQVGYNARHHHEDETRSEIRELVKSDRYMRTRTGVRTREIAGRNDNRVIGSASSGREQMLNSERGRFKNGANYTHSGGMDNSLKWILILIAIIFFMAFFPTLFGGCVVCGSCASGSSHSSSYDSSSDDYDYGWDSSSSYDYDSYDSYDSDGFTYDFDY